MARIISIPTFQDSRGDLSTIDRLLPFDIKRVYYIYNSETIRANHQHKYSHTFIVALNGKIKITCKNNHQATVYYLETPTEGLLVSPEDWISLMFENSSIALCLSSDFYDSNDYV